MLTKCFVVDLKSKKHFELNRASHFIYYFPLICKSGRREKCIHFKRQPIKREIFHDGTNANRISSELRKTEHSGRFSFIKCYSVIIIDEENFSSSFYLALEENSFQWEVINDSVL